MLISDSVGVDGCQNQPLLIVCPCRAAYVLPAGAVTPSGSSKKMASPSQGSTNPPISINVQFGCNDFTRSRICWYGTAC